ncbi:MAG: hypothetical protein ACREKM_06500, partial [Longimicrobiales bacterium]
PSCLPLSRPARLAHCAHTQSDSAFRFRLEWVLCWPADSFSFIIALTTDGDLAFAGSRFVIQRMEAVERFPPQ